MNNYTITPESFILEVIELYKQARKTKIDNSKIARERSRSISSHAEDLFAEFLSENLKNTHTLLINQ